MLEGSVKMISRGGYLFKTYNGGSYFGEIELLQNVYIYIHIYIGIARIQRKSRVRFRDFAY